ncbi:MAG TPA: helix-turn-helix transcriptional regulator, partial [Rhodopila sp.]|nr:helix-turn-helix transcriptional regulator [Rhodopila sp.]
MIEGPSSRGARDPDRSLLRLLGQARRFQDRVLNGQGKTFTELAAELGVTSSYFTRVFRLVFLAPAITQAIMRGQHPAELTANKLMLTGKLALTWSEQ